MSTGSIGAKLRKLREEKKLPLRKVAAMIDIDVAILSKMERGERQLTKKIVEKLAKVYNYNTEELQIHYLSDRLIHEIGEEKHGLKAIQVAEQKVAYLTKPVITRNEIIKNIKSFLKNDGRIQTAWLFGSFARNEDKADSDIDIMVELNHAQKYSMFDIIDISFLLEKKIGKKIDLVEKDSLKVFALETATNDLTKIYG